MKFPSWNTTAQRAPTFSGQASDGRTVSLDDYRGRHLVLYFYPASFTYGCTRETVRFRDAAAELAALGAAVLGVSPDLIDTQCQFASHYQTTFPIVADPELHVASAYGAVFPMLKRVQRTTFVIDPEGLVVARFHHELRFEKHADDAVAFMKKVRGRG